MILYSDWLTDRAESYRTLAQFFLEPPDEEALAAVRQDFNLESSESPEQIAEDFELLFSLSHGRMQPIESVVAPAAGISYSDVNEFYSSAGLVISETYERAPDHLPLELLFMSYLIGNNKTVMEANFLEQHLINWVPYYCEQLSKEAATAFYRGIAGIVKDFLTAEYEEYTDKDYGAPL